MNNDITMDVDRLRNRHLARKAAREFGVEVLFNLDGASHIVSFKNEYDGGPGSGNFGHEGREGKVGGSAPGNGTSSTERKAVTGSDVTSTYKGKLDIESVLHAQGYDGLPKIVNRKTFDDAVKKSKFIAQRAYTATSKEVLDAYRDMLFNGKWYISCDVGGAQYGKGMYCAADYEGNITEGMKNEAAHYADRAFTHAIDTAKLVTRDTFTNDPITKDFDLTDDEISVFRKSLIDTKHPTANFSADEKKVYRKLKNSGKLFHMTNAYFAQQAKVLNNKSEYCANVETFTLTPDAKIVSYDEISKLRNKDRLTMCVDLLRKAYQGKDDKYAKMYCDYYDPSSSLDKRRAVVEIYNSDPSKFSDVEKKYAEIQRQVSEDCPVLNPYSETSQYAALKGYDAINAEGHGQSGSYTIILNRTKCLFLDPSEEEHNDSVDEGEITFQFGDDGLLYAIRNGSVIGWVNLSGGSSKS